MILTCGAEKQTAIHPSSVSIVALAELGERRQRSPALYMCQLPLIFM